MKTKILSFLLAIIMSIGTLGSVVYAEPDPYWAAQKEYNTAMENGDDLGIVSAAQKIQARYANEHNETAYNRMATPTYQAALAYERLGMFTEAGAEYEKAISYSEWLVKNASTEASRAANAENIKAYERHLRYFNIGPEVYALTSNKESVVYYGELNEPEIGTYSGLCGTYNDGLQSGYLLYVQYANDGFSDYEHYLPKTSDVYYLTAAWNSENENEQDLRDVVSGKTDEYMISELKYLESYTKSHPNVRILLRIFAEQNVWKPLDSCGNDRVKIKAYADLYISAYKHIAEAARKYAPSVALVFSPVDYGQWYTEPEDFYPGDEYVDWIGMSTYYNKNSQETNKIGDKGDKNLARGLYNLPVVRTAEIMELAEKHSKPVLIAECGFAYGSYDGLQNETYAREKMQDLYSYINVVYPQVKLINYFNANTSNYYRLYDDTPYSSGQSVNANMRKAYESAILENGSIASVLNSSDSAKSYTKLVNFKENTDKLELVAYFDYATVSDEKVEYILNGAKVGNTSNKLTLNASTLKAGCNTLEVVFTAGKTKITKKYLIYKDINGDIDCKLSTMTDINGNEWFAESIGFCLNKGLLSGTTATTVSPLNNTTRAQLITILYRYAGSPAVKGNNPFVDITADWYKNPVIWAAENDVVNSVSGSSFRPNENITREDLAEMLYRYTKNVLGQSVASNADLSGYADTFEISDYALDAMKWANEKGLITGKVLNGKNCLAPGGEATRAEVATILMRFIRNVVK